MGEVSYPDSRDVGRQWCDCYCCQSHLGCHCNFTGQKGAFAKSLTEEPVDSATVLQSISVDFTSIAYQQHVYRVQYQKAKRGNNGQQHLQNCLFC